MAKKSKIQALTNGDYENNITKCLANDMGKVAIRIDSRTIIIVKKENQNADYKAKVEDRLINTRNKYR